MNNPPKSTSVSKIGAGRSVVNRNERSFKRGSLMFIEGESSSEMFIIRSGKIRILKQEGESTVELAVLGPGSVIGELALLDHQPRSATAQVVEDVTVTVIDQDLFTHTMEKVPPWLSNLIQLVVKRLRETMRRTSDDVVRKSVAGVIRVVLLMVPTEGRKSPEGMRLELSRVKEILYTSIGLGGIEAENVFLHLILKEMIYIRKNELGQEFLVLRNPEIMQLYMGYLRSRQTNGVIVGEKFKDDTFELIEFVRAAGEHNGRKEGEKLIRVGFPQVEIELARTGGERHIDLDALDELVAAKLIIRQDDVTESNYGTHKRSSLVYNDEALRKVSLLHTWLPVFKEDVHF